VLALLLLFQPLLCVAHCILHAQGISAHAGSSSPFLCHASQPPDTGSLLVPAFWPGVLPTLIMLVLAAVSLRLPSPTHAQLAIHLWEPPFPPPRLTIA
jgi:hypothetical protein